MSRQGGYATAQELCGDSDRDMLLGAGDAIRGFLRQCPGVGPLGAYSLLLTLAAELLAENGDDVEGDLEKLPGQMRRAMAIYAECHPESAAAQRARMQ